MKVLAIFTCHNRKEKTIKAIETLVKGNPLTDISFIAVDDGSTDGSFEALQDLNSISNMSIHIIRGDGNLFYSGGMRKGIERAKELLASQDLDAVLLFNDDVEFHEKCLDHALQKPLNRVYVGPTEDGQGKLTYGGARYLAGKRSIKYDTIGPEASDRSCNTFNANFVLIPGDVFIKMPNVDQHYKHSMGDFDLGLELSRMGTIIEVLDDYIGVCLNNSINGTWEDKTLPRIERLKRKESPKGLPFGQWFYFLKKNFGVKQAVIHSVTPYIKILIGL